MADLKREIEAILFSAGRTVKMQELQLLLNLKNPGLITESVKELVSDYESRASPLMIIEEGEGWKINVKESFLPLVQRINPHTELSKTILETLSVIAWKQPALQSDVIKIRTNKAYEHIDELERLGFVSKDRHGRSFRLTVTQKFLDYFDLPDAAAIKDAFKGFKDIGVAAKKKSDTESDESGADNKPPQKVGGLQTFADELPPMQKVKHESEVEVFDLPPEEVKQEELKEVEEEQEEEVKLSAPKIVETPGEKARRLARELLGEDLPKPKVREKGEEKRRLHPELEEFISGAEKELEKGEEEDGSQEDSAESDEEASQEEQEESGDDKSLTEEFPGQFSVASKEKKRSGR
jgi:segregation and condensation protein B